MSARGKRKHAGRKKATSEPLEQPARPGGANGGEGAAASTDDQDGAGAAPSRRRGEVPATMRNYPGGWVLISVSDTGVGIPEKNLERIFEPLLTTKAKGIGLGLTLVKTLVEEHGGTVGVESRVGEGSTFTVRLPLATGKREG